MKRSPITRRTPLRTAGPAKAAVKLKTCKTCGKQFVPISSWARACSVECGLKLVDANNAKKAAKAAAEDRKRTKAQLEALKTISQLESDCRKIVQKIARLRDRNYGCISCHMGPNYGGLWHGSHYRAHGACSSLQFHLWNIHKSCAQCNLFKGGNKEGYIAGLLAKPGYGPERLEWLNCQPKSKRFERDYLLRFKAVMGRRLRRMEKQLASQ